MTCLNIDIIIITKVAINSEMFYDWPHKYETNKKVPKKFLVQLKSNVRK